MDGCISDNLEPQSGSSPRLGRTGTNRDYATESMLASAEPARHTVFYFLLLRLKTCGQILVVVPSHAFLLVATV